MWPTPVSMVPCQMIWPVPRTFPFRRTTVTGWLPATGTSTLIPTMSLQNPVPVLLATSAEPEAMTVSPLGSVMEKASARNSSGRSLDWRTPET